jgi:hypothetical protein
VIVFSSGLRAQQQNLHRRPSLWRRTGTSSLHGVQEDARTPPPDNATAQPPQRRNHNEQLLTARVFKAGYCPNQTGWLLGPSRPWNVRTPPLFVFKLPTSAACSVLAGLLVAYFLNFN